MVKRADVVAGIEAGAGVPYESTRLARSAARARPRLAVIALAGGAALLAAAAIGGAWTTGVLGCSLLALMGWGVARGRLGAVVALALFGVVAFGVGLWDAVSSGRAEGRIALDALAMVFGIATLPDSILLFRDAELQHAYGRWAKRDA